MAFEPQKYLIQLPRKVKDRATGNYRTVYDDYLEVKWRLVMFRERYPHGVIITEEVCVDLDRAYARYKAIVEDGEGGKATGYGTETAKDFPDYCERAETRALGRALAVLGFGTQFVGADLTEGEHVADSPVQTTNGDLPRPTTATNTPQPSAAAEHERPSEPVTPEADITLDHARELRKLAQIAFGFRDGEARLKTDLGFPAEKHLALRSIVAHCAPERYAELRRVYGQALRQTVEADVPDHQPPGPEGTAQAPFASSSAPDGGAATGGEPARDPEASARDALMQEAISLGLPEAECRHVVTMHKDLAKAREILTQAARRKIQAATAAA